MSSATVDPFEADDDPGPDRLLAAPVTVTGSGLRERLREATVRAVPGGPPVTRWATRPRGGPWVVDTAATTGLTGHGGSHVPAVRKWRSAIDHPGPVTLVVNAAESEWLSAKDAVLLQLHPHLVLDGAALVAETVGADRTVVWLHDGAAAPRESVEQACRERSGSDREGPPVSVMTGPSSYLSGESTAIKSAVRGGPLLPPSRASRDRHARAETLVHNVETLARLAVAARASRTAPHRWGAAWTGHHRLLTVLTPTRERRVVEVSTSALLADAVALALGRQPAAATPVLLGGYGGTWAWWSEVASEPVTEDAMQRAGRTLGPGIVAPLWGGGCGLAATAAIVDYLASSSAGQCGPCLFGLRAMADALARIARGRPRPGEVDQLRRDVDAVDGRGACRHPDGAVRMVRSALRVFGDDVARHAAGRTCDGPAGDLIPVPDLGLR